MGASKPQSPGWGRQHTLTRAPQSLPGQAINTSEWIRWLPSRSKVFLLVLNQTQVARAYIRTAPERMVWGSVWPHPTEKEKPDDAALFDLLTEWAPDAATRSAILVQNPARLYGFPATT